MEGAGIVLMMIVVIGVGLCVGGIPGYVLAKRRGLRNPIVAFVPFVGLWIVLFESIGKSGWLGMLAFVPYVGLFVLPIWTGVESLPTTDARAGGRPSSPFLCSTWSASGHTPSRSPSTSALRRRGCKRLLSEPRTMRPLA